MTKEKKDKTKKEVKHIELSKEEILENRCKELEDLLKRLQAEFENYKKQCDKEKIISINCASQDTIIKILPFIDSFECAIKSKATDSKGVEMLYNQLLKILANEGLRKYESLGQKFDPYKHDVLLKEQNEDQEDDIITQEIQAGYILHDKVIRHAKVKINKRSKK